VKTGATFSNSAVPCDSSCPSIAYPTPPATYTFSDALSRQWTVTGSSIKRPGEASPSTVATFTGGVVSSVVRDGVTTTYSRSVAGNVSTMVVTDPLGHSKTITGDIALHRIKSVQDELGHTTSYLYDTFGRLTRITLPEGNYVEYSYDGRGNILTTTVTPKSGSGLLPISASATYPSTCTNQKTCNQPTSTTDPKGNVTDYTYNGTHGGVVTATRPPPALGLTRPETRYSYTSIASASGDPVYQLTGVSACQTGSGCTGLADETKATIAYNPNLLPVSITRANGTGTLSVTDSSTYDPAGNMVTQDGPLSTADITRYRYDADRELTGVMHPDPDGTGPLNIRAVQLTYRPDGQVSKQELGTITGTTSPVMVDLRSLPDGGHRLRRQFAPGHVQAVGRRHRLRADPDQLRCARAHRLHRHPHEHRRLWFAARRLHAFDAGRQRSRPDQPDGLRQCEPADSAQGGGRDRGCCNRAEPGLYQQRHARDAEGRREQQDDLRL
jgi:YD repeat-containing protein